MIKKTTGKPRPPTQPKPPATSNLALADALFGIFGFRRVVDPKTKP